MDQAVIKDVLEGQRVIENKLQDRYQAILASSDIFSKLNDADKSTVEEILKTLLNDAKKQSEIVNDYLHKYA
ncbi:MAG: hypothetical protein COT81_05640 [Candidatus Buchananbacteria bacterium CG10_big_fil_rev_8_21_14_0_10_42_9]|uniref:Uncharacterized protein n=1 Tax=Candidatus Buchananbacteria bacterium CG10_big_fil_rev_8_21_14_0_10_42_9 TaxID=1974526 RepID=A0A2H0VZQ8_9BACT|nr:MAG: hypothetical protein COT81_05640 [Candidatus Buchananbacteria bacterium CG10_big_fil_rev_8_21_14_0_10_42_9]